MLLNLEKKNPHLLRWAIKIVHFIFSNRLHAIAMGPIIIAFWNQLLSLPLDLRGYVVIFGAVWFGYILNIYFDLKEDHFNDEIINNRLMGHDHQTQKLALLVLIGTVSLAFSHSASYGLLALVACLNAGAYSAPFTCCGSLWRIKSNPYIKNMYAALNWSFILLSLAFVYAGITHITVLAVFVCVVCFLMNFFIELLWDVRDCNGDIMAGVHTIPTTFGLSFSRWLLHVINLANVGIVFLGITYKIFPRSFYLVGCHAMAVAVFIEVFVRLPSKRLISHLYLIYVMVALLMISVAHRLVD